MQVSPTRRQAAVRVPNQACGWLPLAPAAPAGNSYQGASHAAVVIQRGRWNEDREHMLVSGHQGERGWAPHPTPPTPAPHTHTHTLAPAIHSLLTLTPALSIMLDPNSPPPPSTTPRLRG